MLLHSLPGSIRARHHRAVTGGRKPRNTTSQSVAGKQPTWGTRQRFGDSCEACTDRDAGAGNRAPKIVGVGDTDPRISALAVADTGPHAPLLLAEFPPAFARFLDAHSLLHPATRAARR